MFWIYKNLQRVYSPERTQQSTCTQVSVCLTCSCALISRIQLNLNFAHLGKYALNSITISITREVWKEEEMDVMSVAVRRKMWAAGCNIDLWKMDWDAMPVLPLSKTRAKAQVEDQAR